MLISKKAILRSTVVIAIIGTILLLRKRFSVNAIGWSSDPNFFYVPSIGKNLLELGKKVGISLKRNKGLGKTYNKQSYQSLKGKTSIYWAVYDITSDSLIASSANAKKNVYAASVSKAIVVGAALENNGGKLPTDADYGKAIRLLVISDNNVWTPLQNIAGGTNAVNNFASKMGYDMKPARNGGNNINAIGMCEFWRDTMRGRYKGAEIIYKITSSCQTSTLRSRRYLPTSCFVGGKTGTYASYSHDSAWIEDRGRFYAITVLTDKNNGSEQVATMFGGLYEEYVKG